MAEKGRHDVVDVNVVLIPGNLTRSFLCTSPTLLLLSKGLSGNENSFSFPANCETIEQLRLLEASLSASLAMYYKW